MSDWLYFFLTVVSSICIGIVAYQSVMFLLNKLIKGDDSDNSGFTKYDEEFHREASDFRSSEENKEIEG